MIVVHRLAGAVRFGRVAVGRCSVESRSRSTGRFRPLSGIVACNLPEGISSMITVSSHSGGQFVRALLRAYEAAGILDRFFTSLAFPPTDLLPSILPTALTRELSRRAFPEVPQAKISAMGFREAFHFVGSRLPANRLTRRMTGFAPSEELYAAVDVRVARAIDRGLLRSRCIHAYEDGAASSFAAATRAGWLKFYDLPIGYWRAAQRIFEEERELQPAWANTLELLQASPWKLERKDQELRLADRIFVPSNFIKSTLSEFPEPIADVQIVPYGAPSQPSRRRRCSRSGPLNVLYVGSLGQRKGLSYLFQAMERLDCEATLTLLGPKPAIRCRPLEEALNRFSWMPPVNHGEVLDLMAQYDVLVLPTLFEGLALVILEAMSQGLPVITTAHSGAGPEIIVDGQQGFIVPIRDPDAIAERLSLLATDGDRLAAMSTAAERRAAERTWDTYGAAMVAAVQPLLSAAKR